MSRRSATIVRAVAILFAFGAPAALGAEPASGPAVELTRHVEKVLAARSKVKKKTWSFAVAADTHVQYYGEKMHDERFEKLLTSWIDAKVDVGIIVGDLGGPGQHKRFGQQIARTRGCPPVLMALGNHEMDRGGKKAWLETIYPGAVAGQGRLNDRWFYYSVNYRGCHFVFLDCDRIVGSKWFGDEVPLEQIRWLEQDLAANRQKLTFLFCHHPIEATRKGKAVHLLANRAPLVAVLRRFPNVRWAFHGHLHYDERVRLWGMNIVHLFREPTAVRVSGGTAELCRITPTGLVPYPEASWNELGRRKAARWSRRDGRALLHIAEKTVEPQDVHALHSTGADGTVRPTAGETMLRFAWTAVPGDKKAGELVQIVLTNTEFIPIVKGMEFAYDVRLEGSAHDDVALHLNVTMPDGGKAPVLLDQNGLPIQPTRTGKWTYRAASLRGKANGRWYSRTCDLGALAGGWIDRVMLVTHAPKPTGRKPAALRLYLDNIRFTQPVLGKDASGEARSTSRSKLVQSNLHRHHAGSPPARN